MASSVRWAAMKIMQARGKEWLNCKTGRMRGLEANGKERDERRGANNGKVRHASPSQGRNGVQEGSGWDKIAEPRHVSLGKRTLNAGSKGGVSSESSARETTHALLA